MSRHAQLKKQHFCKKSNVRKVVYLLNSNHPSSLGLHPAVYFYSQEGRHKTASFLAMVDFVSSLEKSKKINSFIKVREKFESFILDHEYLTQQINRKYRTAQKSYSFIAKFFRKVVESFNQGKSEEEVLNSIQSAPDFSYLTLQKPSYLPDSHTTDFDSGAKSAIYIREALKAAPKCKICNGLIHRNSISFDHIQRKQDGGSGSINNGQLSHPYCNTGYKN